MNQLCVFFQSIHKKFSSFANPTLVKLSIYSSILTFLPGLFIAVLIASIFGPVGYNIIDNYISDLGSINYTPAPFILDIITILTSIFLLPMFFYLLIVETSGTTHVICNKNVSPLKRFHHLGINIHATIGFISFLFGMIGLFGVGLFSEDRTTELNLHFIFSVIVFAGLAFGALFSGITIIFRNRIFSRLLGIYMAIVPFTVSILFLFPPEGVTKPFMEWMMLFSAIGWMISIAVFILRHLKAKLSI